MNSSEEKTVAAIVAAIDRNTEAVREIAVGQIIRNSIMAILLVPMLSYLVGCPRAKADVLVSDGDEIASVGTTRVITPHPSWVQPLEGTSWISIAQTGWPLATWLPNGTVVSFSEVFSLALMPSAAMVTFAADDSAALWLNGSLVLAEAPTAGNAYTVCSDTAPTCTAHNSVDVLPWLALGENTIRFDVAQRGGWSYGLNYAVALTWLDEPPLPTPEPGPRAPLGIGLGCIVGYVYFTRKAQKKAKRYELYLEHLLHNGDEYSKQLARKALEEK